MRLGGLRRGGHTSRFQSTHPSGVRPVLACTVLICWSFQSTHPSGVRRAALREALMGLIISIHAPQWGATQPGYHTGLVHLFQSTHPSGVRLVGSIIGIPNWISIHAPQWGATNPRRLLEAPSESFQSTHPSGVRRPVSTFTARRRDFNPRTPVGCDDFAVSLPQADRVFQSTHPSGVRHRPCSGCRG